MKPYRYLRLIQWPDVADLRRQARPTRFGGLFHRAAVKRRIRRSLKRADKAKEMGR